MESEAERYRFVRISPKTRHAILNSLWKAEDKGEYFKFISRLSLSPQSKLRIVYFCNKGTDPLEGIYDIEVHHKDGDRSYIYLQSIKFPGAYASNTLYIRQGVLRMRSL